VDDRHLFGAIRNIRLLVRAIRQHVNPGFVDQLEAVGSPVAVRDAESTLGSKTTPRTFSPPHNL